jgi:hypothetical protein
MTHDLSRLDEAAVLEGVKVGSTDSARRDRHHDVVGGGLRLRDVLDQHLAR